MSSSGGRCELGIRRVTILKHIAAVNWCGWCSCKDYQNLNSFFAVVMGLSNIAVSRLSQTWEVRYEMRDAVGLNVRSKADAGQLNLRPHGTNNKKWKNREKSKT